MQKAHGAIIFDFDGVLADSVDAVVRALARVALQKKVPILTREFISNNDFNVILEALNVKWWELPYMVYNQRKLVLEIEPSARLFPWATELLNTATNMFDRTWIVSSTPKARILTCLQEAKIDLDKVHVHADVGIFNKHRILKKLIHSEHLDPNMVIYIGDETRDIIAAHKAGIRCLGVSWGLNSSETLKSINKGLVLDDPAKFKTMINELL